MFAVWVFFTNEEDIYSLGNVHFKLKIKLKESSKSILSKNKITSSGFLNLTICWFSSFFLIVANLLYLLVGRNKQFQHIPTKAV